MFVLFKENKLYHRNKNEIKGINKNEIKGINKREKEKEKSERV
jgi:hypothetical protein